MSRSRSEIIHELEEVGSNRKSCWVDKNRWVGLGPDFVNIIFVWGNLTAGLVKIFFY